MTEKKHRKRHTSSSTARQKDRYLTNNKALGHH